MMIYSDDLSQLSEGEDHRVPCSLSLDVADPAADLKTKYLTQGFYIEHVAPQTDVLRTSINASMSFRPLPLQSMTIRFRCSDDGFAFR